MINFLEEMATLKMRFEKVGQISESIFIFVRMILIQIQLTHSPHFGLINMYVKKLHGQ